MVILGIADGIEAGAAVVIDDRLVATAAESHYARVPLTWGMPWRAMSVVLEAAGVDASEVDQVAIAGRITPPLVMRKHPRLRRLATGALAPAADAGTVFRAMLRRTGLGEIEADRAQDFFEERLAERGYRPRRVNLVDIHRALAAAVYRDQVDEDLLVVVAHPMGDGATLSVFDGSHGQLHLQWVQPELSSLHVHLQRCADSVGLSYPADAHRLWSLASHGEADPAVVERLDEELRAEGPRLARRRVLSANEQAPYASLGRVEREVAAASVAANLSGAVCAVVAHHLQRSGKRRLAVAGSVFDNPWLCADVASLAGVDHLVLCREAGYGALALGAAASVAGMAPHPTEIWTGRSFDDQAMTGALGAAGLTGTVVPSPPVAVAEELGHGGLVAWFAASAERGPIGGGGRALWALPTSPRVEALRARRGEPFVVHRADEPGFEGVDDHGRVASVPVVSSEAPWSVVVPRCGRVLAVRARRGSDLEAMLGTLREVSGSGVAVAWPLAPLAEPLAVTPRDAIRTFRETSASALVLGGLKVLRPVGPLPATRGTA